MLRVFEMTTLTRGYESNFSSSLYVVALSMTEALGYAHREHWVVTACKELGIVQNHREISA